MTLQLMNIAKLILLCTSKFFRRIHWPLLAPVKQIYVSISATISTEVKVKCNVARRIHLV